VSEVGRGLAPRTAMLLASSIAGIVLVAVGALLPTHYVVVKAGPVFNTLGPDKGQPLIDIQGQRTYPTTGELDLTTVRVFGGPGSSTTLLEVLEGWANPGEDVVPYGDVYGRGTTPQQNKEQGHREMVTSQEAAAVAALRLLGYAATQIEVAEVARDAPAAAVIAAGDRILSVNGTATPDGDLLHTALQKVTPGQAATVVIERAGQRRTVSARTRRGPDGSTLLGVSVELAAHLPFPVKINLNDVDGPSAGTMFALGIVDKLTPADLAGGRHIAGTGTVDVDGLVGPIGGVRQKMLGARSAGADFFLAPADDCSEVTGHVPEGLSVVKISTLAQARDAVAQIGRTGSTAGLPRCP
jgi:Lon-like protease